MLVGVLIGVALCWAYGQFRIEGMDPDSEELDPEAVFRAENRRFFDSIAPPSPPPPPLPPLLPKPNDKAKKPKKPKK